MNWELDELDPLLQEIWKALTAACASMTHPFRSPVLATARQESAAVRTVILREASQAERRLTCFTDRRSAKVARLAAHPGVEWLFYDPGAGVQIRARATAVLTDPSAADQARWDALPLPSRMLYCALLPPGTPVTHPVEAWPEFVQARNPTLESVRAGWPHFGVIHSQVEQIDFLHLDWELQRRAVFKWTLDKWQANWVVP